MATRETLLATTFIELADTLVADFDVIGLLTRLSQRCVQLLDASAVGVLLADLQGNLTVIAASSDEAELLELFQVQKEEGPCVDCFRRCEAVVCADLTRSEVWPRFGPVALAAGFASVHAFPMRLRDQVLGTLNLFIAEPRPLSPADVVIAQALADAASIAILQDTAARDARITVRQFRQALSSRVTIEQAKGVLSERQDISTEQAFSHLRSAARKHRIKLNALASAVVDGTVPDAVLTDLAGSDAEVAG